MCPDGMFVGYVAVPFCPLSDEITNYCRFPALLRLPLLCLCRRSCAVFLVLSSLSILPPIAAHIAACSLLCLPSTATLPRSAMSADPAAAPQDDPSAAEQAAAAAAAADSGAAPVDELTDDAEIEAIRARVAEMEEEERKMAEIGGGGAGAGAAAAGSPAAAPGGRPVLSAEQSADQDSRSIHVSQVDYSVTEEELKKLFEACGAVNRATILKDKFTGNPKGFAYVEFAAADSVSNAMILNETEFKGRTLKVNTAHVNHSKLTAACEWISCVPLA